MAADPSLKQSQGKGQMQDFVRDSVLLTGISDQIRLPAKFGEAFGVVHHPRTPANVAQHEHDHRSSRWRIPEQLRIHQRHQHERWREECRYEQQLEPHDDQRLFLLPSGRLIA